jgi:uncharacterized protein with HEPN domain
MTLSRLEDYLEHMHQASADACSFVDGMSKSDFLQDKRTQQAVIMSFVILGEASRKIMDSYPEFVADQPTIPWRSMRGMRNRITHGYFDTNLDLVWDTLTNALPDLVRKIAHTRSQLG